jgi:hypothetical protein
MLAPFGTGAITMRMWHYFAGLAALFAPALLATAYLGLTHDGSSKHLWAGLFAGALGVGVHTLVILFMLITGRVIREAIRARSLDPEFLAELNRFFAKRRAYPLAGLAAASLVAAGVLGYGSRGFGISPAWHWGAGIGALLLNLWALQLELRVLMDNQALVDRVAAELDRIDRESPPPAPEAPPGPPFLSVRTGLTIALAAWLPYLYWALIVWRGDFAEVPIHPWLEISLAGLLLAFVARRRAR